MQIDRQNYLLFPHDNAPTAAGNGAASGAAAPAAGQPHARAPATVASEVGVAHAASAVLNIQWPDDPVTVRNRGEAPVYSPVRKAVGRDDADVDGQAQAHQRALERNSGVFTQLTVNKDGVLVAKAQASAESKQPDFVALAVSAMREFSDEAERVKAAQPPAAEAPPSATGWGKLKDLQHQFASRFKALA
jgi:hypothetical protein